MTEATQSSPLPPELQSWFAAWQSCTQDVLSQVSGQPNAFEISAEPLKVSDSDLRYTILATGAVQGETALRLPEASAIRLAHKFLGDEATAFESITNDDREALEELLRQIAGLVATAEARASAGKMQLGVSRADSPLTWTPAAVATLRTRNEAGNEITIEVGISPVLAAAIAAAAAAVATPASPPVPTPAASSSVAGEAPPDAKTAGYHRLLDVGLGVKLRFGTRRMLLRDVLALSSGLVVELDNALHSPVDLLLDGRIIARGDVVVIDGKYGLRVTDVVDSSPPAGNPQ